MATTINITDLPENVAEYILSICTPAECAVLRATCKWFRVVHVRERVPYYDWIKYGSLPMIKRVTLPVTISPNEIPLRAIDLNKADIMVWAARNCLISNYELFHHAIRANNTDMIRAIRDMGAQLTPYVFKSAVELRNLDIMKWLYAQNCPMDSSAMRAAIGPLMQNNIPREDIIQWLIDIKCPVDKSVYIMAYTCHRYDIIHSLTIAGNPVFTAGNSVFTAGNSVFTAGHLGAFFSKSESIPTLEHIYAQVDINSNNKKHRSFIKSVENCATLADCVDVIKWLHKKKYVFSKNIVSFAYQMGSIDVYDYLSSVANCS